MKLYKIIDENTIKKAPKYIKDGSLIISNPPVDKLKDLGYMELVSEPYPETDEGFYRTPTYHIDGDKIFKSWSEPIAAEGGVLM